MSKFLDSETPKRPGIFVGRVEEIQGIRRFLGPSLGSSIPLALISGPPGIGKTALAATIYYDKEVQSQFDVYWFTASSLANYQFTKGDLSQAPTPAPEDCISWQQRLTELKGNLRLVKKQLSKFVMSTDPGTLPLEKQIEELNKQIFRLERQLERCPDNNQEELGIWQKRLHRKGVERKLIIIDGLEVVLPETESFLRSLMAFDLVVVTCRHRYLPGFQPHEFVHIPLEPLLVPDIYDLLRESRQLDSGYRGRENLLDCALQIHELTDGFPRVIVSDILPSFESQQPIGKVIQELRDNGVYTTALEYAEHPLQEIGNWEKFILCYVLESDDLQIAYDALAGTTEIEQALKHLLESHLLIRRAHGQFLKLPFFLRLYIGKQLEQYKGEDYPRVSAQYWCSFAGRNHESLSLIIRYSDQVLASLGRLNKQKRYREVVEIGNILADALKEEQGFATKEYHTLCTWIYEAAERVGDWQSQVKQVCNAIAYYATNWLEIELACRDYDKGLEILKARHDSHDDSQVLYELKGDLHWERAKIEQQWKRYTQAIEQAEEAYRAYKSYEPSVNELTKAATVALEVAGWLISLKEFDQARDWLNRVNSLKCRELYYMAREAEEARLMHFVIQANVMFARLHIERMGQTEDSLAISLEYLEQALEHARNYAPDLETTLRRFIAVAEQERERLNQPNSPVRISDHGLKNPAYCACGEYLLLLDYLRGNVEVCFQCNNAYHKHHKQCPYCGVSKHKCPYCHMLYSEEATP